MTQTAATDWTRDSVSSSNVAICRCLEVVAAGGGVWIAFDNRKSVCLPAWRKAEGKVIREADACSHCRSEGYFSCCGLRCRRGCLAPAHNCFWRWRGLQRSNG